MKTTNARQIRGGGGVRGYLERIFIWRGNNDKN